MVRAAPPEPMADPRDPRTNLWARYLEARARADRVSRMIMDRAREACRQAGLDPSIIGIHVHNALVGLHYGQPWRGVDYKKVRLANYLMELSFKPHRLLDQWYRRQAWPGRFLDDWRAYVHAQDEKDNG